MPKTYKEFLVVRNDKMGDFILIWPALAWLKKNISNCKIVCIISQEVTRLAEYCPYIDDIIIDDKINVLKNKLNNYDFTASISFFSTLKIGYILKSINIPIRIAPKTKIAQFFYNHKVLQKRSKSLKPEFEYNLDLVDELFKILNLENIKDADDAPFLTLDYEKSLLHKKEFVEKYKLKENKKIIFLHPSTGGSSKGLSIDTYADLCKGLRKFDDYNFLIHTSHKDRDIAKELEEKTINDVSINIVKPTNDLSNMIYNINIADIFIAGSTGPLHVAGALNKATIAFYPNKRSSTSLRWETINSFKKRLSFTDLNKSRKHITIDMKKSILEIQKFIGSQDII
tara:strand:- start:1808 stop:2830 length:1023 start_codon:yes stop_codon:yes gene_type:complete